MLRVVACVLPCGWCHRRRRLAQPDQRHQSTHHV